MSEIDKKIADVPESLERREFIAKAGRYAGATSAAVLVLLSTTKDAEATGIFRSGGGYPPIRKNKTWKKKAKKVGPSRWKKLLEARKKGSST